MVFITIRHDKQPYYYYKAHVVIYMQKTFYSRYLVIIYIHHKRP